MRKKLPDNNTMRTQAGCAAVRDERFNRRLFVIRFCRSDRARHLSKTGPIARQHPWLASSTPVRLDHSAMNHLLQRLTAFIAVFLVAAICFGFAPTQSAKARDLPPGAAPWYLGLQGGGVFPDRARGVADGAFVGIRFGKVLGPDWNAEFNVLDSRHPGNHGMPRLGLRQFSLDVLRVFNRRGEVAPFLKIGVGLLEDEPKGSNSRTNVMGEAGLGLILHLWTSENGRYSFDLRPEVEARWDGCRNCGQTITDALAGIGFDLNFGGQNVAPPPFPPPAPHTARPPTRASHSAPPPPPVTPPPPPAPRPATPQSPPSKPIVLTRVHFAVNSARLKPESRNFLERVAAGLKANPDIHVAIYGYTDSTGSAVYNLELSWRRAEAVRDYLIDQGIPASQLSAKGFGKADPVAPNDTAAGRQANRRTAMRVTRNPRDLAVEKVLCGPSC